MLAEAFKGSIWVSELQKVRWIDRWTQGWIDEYLQSNYIQI